MKYNAKRAVELAESFVNGNRGDVVKELAKYGPLDAALTVLAMARSMTDDSGCGCGSVVDLHKAIEARA